MNVPNLHGVRMWVTEGCNASCHFCLNASDRTDSCMDLSKYKDLCIYFKRYGFDRIAIMGGEPTIHPDFISIMEIAQSCFDQVFLFTNALNCKKLCQFIPRDKDVIIYNANFANELTKEKLLLSRPGKRVLDVVINHNSKINIMEDSLSRIIYDYGNSIIIQLVIDNKCNIFVEKEPIVRNINQLFKSLSKIPNANIRFECNAPICFTEGTDLPVFKQNSICSPNSVLVDAKYNIRFCNIFTSPILNMFKDGEIIPFRILENYVNYAFKQHQLDCLSKICLDCIYYNRLCNGKCYIGQSKITRNDIEENTNIPWLKHNSNGTK